MYLKVLIETSTEGIRKNLYAVISWPLSLQIHFQQKDWSCSAGGIFILTLNYTILLKMIEPIIFKGLFLSLA